MNIEVYINGKPIDAYPPKELEELKRKLTYKAMDAAGFVPAHPERKKQ